MTDYCGKNRLDWMDTLAQVLRHHPSADHIWHGREQHRYPLHPAVREAVMTAPPADWHLLVLQWPHVSIKDAARLAYTRTIEHGFADRQTVTGISKYLTEHFPNIQSHLIRDICAKYGNHQFQITHEIEQMLAWLADSPASCMVRRNWRAGDWHPYRVYDPKFGWGLAVRLENGQVAARALINEESKSFVRSFGWVENDRGHSQNDNALNSWLQSQGYSYCDGWDGLKLALIEHPDGGWSAPYLDGDTQRVHMAGTSFSGHLLITDAGDYCCTNTDGHLDDDEDHSDCEDCGDRIYIPRGNHIWAGRYEDRLVCESCSDQYARAIGANGDEYYEHESDCTWIQSREMFYVDRYFSINNIVYCEDTREHEHQNDSLYLDQRDIWVSMDCTYSVFCEDTCTHEHIEDCVLLEDGTYVLRDDNESEAAA
jgi:hypothetical protein